MSLSRTRSLTLATILRDCSDQLDILGYTLMSREDSSAPAQETARLTKLKRECQLISQHISELSSELEQKQSFTSLQRVVEKEEQRVIEKEEQKAMQRGGKKELMEREEQLQRKQKELEAKKQLLKDLNQQVTRKESEIARKKDIAALIVKTNELQLQEAQIETSKPEKRLVEHMRFLQRKLQQEMSSHEECMKFLQNRNKDLQQQLLQWNERSEQMLKEKKQKLNNVQCKRKINADRLMETRRRFTEMEQVVVEDREKMKKLQQQQKEVKAAIKLQAWWRGCMVRHGLISFGKAEEDKKGKKKKTGGKNKKKK